MVAELHLLSAVLAAYVLVVDCAAFELIILLAENLGVRFFQKEELMCCIHEIWMVGVFEQKDAKNGH